jgi:uncharacterized transporter YbjL
VTFLMRALSLLLALVGLTVGTGAWWALGAPQDGPSWLACGFATFVCVGLVLVGAIMFRMSGDDA